MARPYDLPSMTSLLCFEAAARNLSFKKAAAELNVTPTAVSHQIRHLESDLGRKLFDRGHRGVELTEVGAYLFVSVRKGLEGMSDTVRDMRDRAEREDVVVGVTTAMSAFWLTPRISGFWRENPDIVISQSVSDVGRGAERLDISLHYGEVPDDNGDYRPLFRDRILALGAPGFADTHGISGIDRLRTAPLIHLVAEPGWTGWTEWFEAIGQPAPRGRKVSVNNYMIALQLAQDGAGAVLGWDGLVGPLLESGQLVPLVEDCIAAPQPFYLKLHPGASEEARLFGDWLVSQQSNASRSQVMSG